MTVMVQTDLNRIFMEKTGINEVQIKKLEQLSKDGLGGSIDQNFSMPIVNGSGSYNYSTTSFWVTISGYALFSTGRGLRKASRFLSNTKQALL